MKVGVTATRLGLTEKQRGMVAYQLWLLEATEVHHGDCAGGDAEICEIARSGGAAGIRFSWLVRTVGHPPLSDRLRAHTLNDEERLPRPFRDRNRAIVDETEHLLAAPFGPEELRSGTWSTVRYARKVGKPVTVVHRDGRCEGWLP